VRYLALANAAGSAYRYALDPQEQLGVWTRLEEDGEVVWAIVHSHVTSTAEPSATDIELAYYPDSLYLICSLIDTEQPTTRAWSIVDDAVSEVPLTISS